MATSRGALGLLEDAAGEESVGRCLQLCNCCQETQARFTEFAAAHGKTYGSPQEQRTRLHAFRNNLRSRPVFAAPSCQCSSCLFHRSPLSWL